MAKTDHSGRGVEHRHEGVRPGGFLRSLQKVRAEEKGDKSNWKKAEAKANRRENIAHENRRGRK